MKDVIHKLQSLYPDAPHSRVHRLRTIKATQETCYIKREDELSFSISGSKLRKYLPLHKWLQKKNPQNIGIIGSCFSNNVLGLSQKMIEWGFPYTLFLLKPHAPIDQSSNFFLLKLLQPNIQFIERAQWAEVDSIAATRCDCIIPEGAFLLECLEGIMTLGLDILENEREIGSLFNHIFIDAGTGFSAIGLILFFSIIKKQSKLHICSCSIDEKTFNQQLQLAKLFIENHYSLAISRLIPYSFYYPETGKSFGSFNATYAGYLKKFASSEGIFLDPLYSVKMFYHAEKIVKELTGNCLLIHSGGGTSLLGFQPYF